MPPPDLIDLMRLYARRGIADWRNARPELRRRAALCLGTSIADNETEAMVTIYTMYNNANTERLRFIPMPKHLATGIEYSFFLPIREKGKDGSETATFELFLLVSGKNCLAFRIEPAHRSTSTHGYGHVQMSRSMLRKTIMAVVPQWLPDRYPAFPLPTSDPLQMFLSMATAVHGYSGGVVALLQSIFQTANRASDAVVYVDQLKKILN